MQRRLLILAIGLLAIPRAQAPEPTRAITLELLGTYATGIFDQSAAEIPAYDPETRQLFVVNAQSGNVDVIDISDPRTPALKAVLDVSPYGAIANSVAVSGGLVAVAVEADPKTDPGVVVFFDTQLNFLNVLTVGALPDMLTFTPDGQRLLVANEGEPSEDYSLDPEGTVSIIEVWRGVRELSDADVITVDFRDFNAGGPRHDELPEAVRIFGPGASVAQDLEPEWIAISPDSSTAYVVLQENNAIAVIDIDAAKVVAIYALGFKDHSLPGNGFDASDRNPEIDIRPWPVFGMYQPDSIAVYEVLGQRFIVTANEGDARDWPGYSEEVRLSSLTLNPEVFPDAAELQRPETLGRLRVSSAMGDLTGDGRYEAIYAFGARSFAIWTEEFELVWDSGDHFEQITAARFPEFFNANHRDNSPDTFKSRSDDKGPEPEALAIGELDGRIYAFIGLERIGGIMIYDISDPYAPRFVDYVNNRTFGVPADSPEAGDLGPEGIIFVPAAQSPIGEPLLIVANEVSGTTSIFQVVRP